MMHHKARSAVHPTPVVSVTPQLESRAATTSQQQQQHPECRARASLCACAATAVRQLVRMDVWREAVRTVAVVLECACVCVACAWAANWVFSLGNIFSGKPPAQQSDREFVVAASLINFTVFYLMTVATHAPVLQSFKYTNHAPDYRPHFWHCVARLVWMTSVTLSISLVFFIASCYAIAVAPRSVRKRCAGFYVFVPWVHMYTTANAIAVRRIYRNETIAGQRRQPQQPANNPPPDRRVWYSWVYFWQVYVQTLPKALVVLAAGLYVQLVSQVQIASTLDFLLYSAANMALKFAIKEVSKRGIVWCHVTDVRTIFVVAGLPTLLINTQVRVMLQRIQSTNYTLAWTLATAALECTTRVGGVVITERAVQRKMQAMHVGTIARIPLRALALAPIRESPTSRDKSVFAASSTTNSFQRWRRQIRAFQVAEIYANMSAEYIAIGSSAAIVFFFWKHPKYDLNPSRDVASETTTPRHTSDNAIQVATGIALQVVVEAIVDVLASAFEISAGVDFAKHVRANRRFIGLFFVTITILNILISAMIYHDPD